jgi:23S rRNA pseudouridine1911/1915/1917 synthase
MEKAVLSVLTEDVSKRIDIYLSERLPKFSRSFFKNLIENRHVKVNNAVIDKSSYSVKLNDLIEVNFPIYEAIQTLGADQDLGVQIIYEHNDFLILYKPAQLVVHKPSSKSKDLTLVDWVVHNFKDLKNVGDTDRPGIVHRLDKDTSGVLVVAKNDQSHLALAEQIKRRQMKRVYLALVHGHPPENGRIEAPIGRHPVERKKMAVVPKGRSAATNFKVVEYLGSYTLVEARLETGRTHQIRVHFSYLGYPLVGDSVYGYKKEPVPLKGQALHATTLGFNHPQTDQYLEFTTPMPEIMAKALEWCRRKQKGAKQSSGPPGG